MARVDEADLHVRVDGDGFVVFDADAVIDRVVNIRALVEGARRGPTAVTGGDAGDLGLALLDARGVLQHDGDQVARRRGAVDRPREALADEIGQVAAVVDMGMAEQHRIDIRRRERELPIAFVHFLALPEHQPAIEQDACIGGFDEVHRAGDGLGGAVKGDADSRNGKRSDHARYCIRRALALAEITCYSKP